MKYDTISVQSFVILELIFNTFMCQFRITAPLFRHHHCHQLREYNCEIVRLSDMYACAMCVHVSYSTAFAFDGNIITPSIKLNVLDFARGTSINIHWLTGNSRHFSTFSFSIVTPEKLPTKAKEK